MKETTAFNDLLNLLEVPHTLDYANEQFHTMPFRSMFGFSKLLQRYGIDSQGVTLGDKSEVDKIAPPFLAQTGKGFIIVTAIDSEGVNYLTEGVLERMSRDEFADVWNGFVMMAFPTRRSIEPHYLSHRRMEIIGKAKQWILTLGVVALFLYLFISNHLYADWSTIALTLFNIGGIYLTYLLVQKSSGMKNRAADAVCGVLQAGGCDSVLEMKASKFFGIFGWSEVGFSYFTVSLLTLLMFPQWICYLAACNVMCLPFTFWSIWYQKFRAKVWCTLCVSVQATLWLLFFCYLGGGWLNGIFPLRIEFFVLCATYLTTLLALNKVLPHFDQKIKTPQPDEDY